MANPLPLVALASEDLGLTATYSMSNEDADYPASNLTEANPAKVAKSTTNTTTITVTTASDSIVAAALINTNATSATVNGVSVTIPSLDADGQRVHGWLDRRTSPIGPTTTWTIVLSRASGAVWIGHIALLSDLHDFNLRYAMSLGRRRPGDVQHVSRLGTALKMPATIRTRWARGVANLIEDIAFHQDLEAAAQGIITPFVFIPDEAVNDAWFVSFAANDFQFSVPEIDVREVPFAFEELSSGPPNG